MKKYALTSESIQLYKRTLYRIVSLVDFSNIKAGTLGGFVENEKNLSHDGDCWIYDNAKVYGDAKVYDNAKIYSNARIFGKTEIFGNIKISEITRKMIYNPDSPIDRDLLLIIEGIINENKN